MDEPVSNYQTSKDLCLIRAWQSIVRDLSTFYKNQTSIAVNHFQNKPITSSDITKAIREAAKAEKKKKSYHYRN